MILCFLLILMFSYPLSCIFSEFLLIIGFLLFLLLSFPLSCIFSELDMILCFLLILMFSDPLSCIFSELHIIISFLFIVTFLHSHSVPVVWVFCPECWHTEISAALFIVVQVTDKPWACNLTYSTSHHPFFQFFKQNISKLKVFILIHSQFRILYIPICSIILPIICFFVMCCFLSICCF